MIKPLVVIVGPTASGKSALALEVAKKYSGELICADSRTVYKGMDIGTAKPTPAEQKSVRHHLVDIVEPNQPFTAAEFKSRALAAIDDITTRNKLPILVGGTGLYVDSVIFDFQFGAKADPRQRAQLDALTVEELQQVCLDNGIPLPVNTQNKRHLVRAVERGGAVEQPQVLRKDTIVVGITTKKEELLSRITDRAHQMIDSGVVQEVARLAKRYGWESEALTGNIYRAFRPVVDGVMSLEEGIQQFVASDMRLAKRQMTWFKRNPYIVWGVPDQLKLVIEHFVQQIMLDKSISDD